MRKKLGDYNERNLPSPAIIVQERTRDFCFVLEFVLLFHLAKVIEVFKAIFFHVMQFLYFIVAKNAVRDFLGFQKREVA